MIKGKPTDNNIKFFIFPIIIKDITPNMIDDFQKFALTSLDLQQFCVDLLEVLALLLSSSFIPNISCWPANARTNF